jgi:SAM-dependent methyltransferase
MSQYDDLFREWDLYGRIGRANYMRQREVASVVRETLERRAEPLRVLDLGCGDGAMSHAILARVCVAKFVGVDLSESAMERFEGRGFPGVCPDDVRGAFRRGDIEDELRLLPADSFDLVHAGYSLHHYPEAAKERVLDDIARVLDRGGWLIWTDIRREEGESRDAYALRLEAEVNSNWGAIAPEERRSVVEHIRGGDFPEPESWMIERARSRGLQLLARLFHDDFYTSLLLERTRGTPGRIPE